MLFLLKAGTRWFRFLKKPMIYYCQMPDMPDGLEEFLKHKNRGKKCCQMPDMPDGLEEF